ncbi:hypothetical protein MED297_02965 [Reinekea sp. MED297]|uniref:Uncharacterized protein n=1 Tax=Reinekea blandensis MED297 TaxID=314283 RepID=A4BGY5_9GAMM|nr:hypothetical protein MED297_02965 [Reinekea sp. MED297] [Reinekea blandensis MED297]
MIQSHHWVFDAVYIPAMTEFLTAETAVGAAELSGIDLLLYQGLDAFQHFIRPDHDNADVYAIAESLRQYY